MSARPARLTLHADTANDLMTENPISMRQDATIDEAIVMLADRAYRIAPVIDERGRPIGVISATDILIHQREGCNHPKAVGRSAGDSCSSCASNSNAAGVGVAHSTTVDDIMTPGVVTVRRNALAGEVIQTMKSQNIHHLFVADDGGSLIGVISLGDILRRLE
jgi:CBS domain-containing protein